MAEEAPQKLWLSGETASFAADVGLDVVDGVRREVREATVLEVAPEEFDRVEVRSVGWEPDDVATRVSGQPALYAFVLVRAPAIPHQDERTADMARELAQKAHDLRSPNVEARVQGQREREAAAPWRHDEGTDPGDLLVRAGAHRERGRRPAWRPRATEYRHHQEAGFIEADQMGAEPAEFFLRAPSRGGPSRAPADRRAPWRGVAAAAG